MPSPKMKGCIRKCQSKSSKQLVVAWNVYHVFTTVINLFCRLAGEANDESQTSPKLIWWIENALVINVNFGRIKKFPPSWPSTVFRRWGAVASENRQNLAKLRQRVECASKFGSNRERPPSWQSVCLWKIYIADYVVY